MSFSQRDFERVFGLASMPAGVARLLTYKEVAGDPNTAGIVPEFIGQEIFNTATGELFRAVAMTGTGAFASVGGGIYIPPALGFDFATFPVVLSLTDPGGDAPATGSVNVTPEAMFDRFSTARTAPAVTYYVDLATGNDNNAGTSPGAKLASIGKAISLQIASGLKTRVEITAGEYSRNFGPNGQMPNNDIAFVAVGGRVVAGTFEAPTVYAFTADATFANTFSMTLGAVDRVVNRTVQNAFGSNRDFRQYASAAALRDAGLTEDGFAYESGKLYIRRQDGATPTYVNTRIYRQSVSNFRFRSAISVYMENIDAEGCSSTGAGTVDYWPTAKATETKVFVAKGSTAKYTGGVSGGAGRGFSIDNLSGLAYLSATEGTGNLSDGHNFHDTNGFGTQVLTVNCKGFDNGRGTQASANGHTCHETVKCIDLAGQYLNNRGGSVRHVNDVKAIHIGTSSTDLGDLATPGANAAFQADGSSGGDLQVWCDRTKAPNAAGKVAYLSSGTGKLNLRNVAPTDGTSGGSGMIGPY